MFIFIKMLPSSQDDDWSNEDDDFAMALNGISSFFTIQQSLENYFYVVVFKLVATQGHLLGLVHRQNFRI